MLKAPKELHAEGREGLQSSPLVAPRGAGAADSSSHLGVDTIRGQLSGMRSVAGGVEGAFQGQNTLLLKRSRSLPPLAPEATSWTSARVARKG